MGTHPIFESDFDCLTDRKETKCCDDSTRSTRSDAPKLLLLIGKRTSTQQSSMIPRSQSLTKFWSPIVVKLPVVFSKLQKKWALKLFQSFQMPTRRQFTH